jgi:phospholipid transport system substrate-binding protein
MRKGITAIHLLVILSLFFAVEAYAGTPLKSVQTKVDAVLKVLGDPTLQDDSAKTIKEEKVLSIIDTIFDYSELARRTLGKQWVKLNGKQQEEFTDLFSTHLRNVYMDRILAYSDEKVVFNKEKKKKDRALVYSSVVTKSKEIPMDYRLVQKSGEWKVYDVVVEGVSLVKNYRSQFREMLSKENPEYLLNSLREKVEKKG